MKVSRARASTSRGRRSHSSRSTCPSARRCSAMPCACSTASRSEEHTSELQSLMRISYAVFCLKKKHKNDEKIHKLNRTFKRPTEITKSNKRRKVTQK